MQIKTSMLGSGGACISLRAYQKGSLGLSSLLCWTHLITVHRMGTADSSSPFSEELCEDTGSPIAEGIVSSLMHLHHSSMGLHTPESMGRLSVMKVVHSQRVRQPEGVHRVQTRILNAL